MRGRTGQTAKDPPEEEKAAAKEGDETSAPIPEKVQLSDLVKLPKYVHYLWASGTKITW